MKATVEAVLLFFHKFVKINILSRNIQKVLQKIWGGHFLGEKKAPAGILPVAPNFFYKKKLFYKNDI